MAFNSNKYSDKPVVEQNDLKCSAHGCPLKWSIEPGRLCSYHFSEIEPTKWPAITDELQRIGPWQLTKSPTPKLNNYIGDPKGWAKRLRDMDDSGEKLGTIHRQMYKEALNLKDENDRTNV